MPLVPLLFSNTIFCFPAATRPDGAYFEQRKTIRYSGFIQCVLTAHAFAIQLKFK